MFWGLIMEPKRRYTQVVKRAFHISMASLDITSGNDDPTQVLLTYDGRNYLLCTLQKGKDIQVPLDLNFEEGNQVSFATNGSCHVHLTGYIITDELDDEEEEEEDENEKKVLKKNAGNEFKKSVGKKKRKSTEESSPNVSPKKSKTAQLLDAVNSDSNDSEDLNFSDILKEQGLEEEQSEDDDVNEEESGDENIEESEDDESGEEEESSISDDAFEPEKPKVNGVTPKKKEKKQEQEKTPKEKQQKTSKSKTPKEVKTPKEKKAEKGEKTPGKEQQTPQGKKKTLEGGVQIQDLVVGTGQLAKPGKFVQVYYEGRLKNNNKVFDSVKQGSGFKFRLGSQEVIKGWDVGVQGMKVGGKRRIVCPPNMAYGQKGSPPVIPSNAALLFEVELKNVH